MHPNNDNTFLKCCFCLRTCLTLEDLQGHIGSEHFNYHPFTCAYCPEGNGRAKFSTKTAIKRHCFEEHGMKRFHIRLWVSEEVENDEKEIQKCMHKCVNGARRNQLALPSQQSMMETQLVEFPSSEDRFSQANVRPQAEEILFSISSSGGSSGEKRINSSSQLIKERQAAMANYMDDKNITSEQDEYTDSSESSRNQNEQNAVMTPVAAASATAHITIIDERSLNPFRKSLAIPSPRKRTHDMSIPSSSNHFKQIAKKTATTEIEEKAVCNIRRQAFVNSSNLSQRQLTVMQQNEERDQRRSLNRSQRSLNPSWGSGGARGQLRCTACRKFYRNQNYDLRSHINNSHLRLPLFSCAECHKHFFNRRFKAIEHIQQFHRGKTNLLIDNTAVYEPIVADRLLEFFPGATVFPGRTPTAAHVSRTRVSRSSVYLQQSSITEQTRVTRSSNFSSQPATKEEIRSSRNPSANSTHSFGRARSVGSDSRGGNGKNGPRAFFTRSNGIMQYLHSTANSSLPSLTRTNSMTSSEPAAVKPVLARGRSMPPREPSPFTTFAYDSGSEEYNRSKTTSSQTQAPSCFSPEYSKAIYKGDKVKKIECGKCKTKVNPKLDWILLNHVNIIHMKVAVFDCLICGESFCEYSGTSVKRHMKSYHPNHLDSFQDNRPFYRDQLQKICLDYFARK